MMETATDDNRKEIKVDSREDKKFKDGINDVNRRNLKDMKAVRMKRHVVEIKN